MKLFTVLNLILAILLANLKIGQNLNTNYIRHINRMSKILQKSKNNGDIADSTSSPTDAVKITTSNAGPPLPKKGEKHILSATDITENLLLLDTKGKYAYTASKFRNKNFVTLYEKNTQFQMTIDRCNPGQFSIKSLSFKDNYLTVTKEGELMRGQFIHENEGSQNAICYKLAKKGCPYHTYAFERGDSAESFMKLLPEDGEYKIVFDKFDEEKRDNYCFSLICQDPCQTCTMPMNPNACLSCYDKLLFKTQCLDKCPGGFAASPKKTCDPCDQTCATCHEPNNPNQCKHVNQRYF